MLATVRPAPGKIDLVTLPDRGAIELTIYNNEDLTLVRERRVMSFAEGLNKLQFSWANTLIDPTSLQLDVLEGGANLDVLDISYPADTQNTLVWNIQAGEAATGKVEISYFTSGITWSADYVVRANADEDSASIEGFVRVTNNSGEDYLQATTRLIVGEINLVEQIAELARRGMSPQVARREAAKQEMRQRGRNLMMDASAEMMPAAPMMAGAAMAPKEVAKAGIGEYFLFTIEGTEDITNELSKRLPSFRAAEVPLTLMYKRDQERWGDQLIKFYTLINDEESNLGKSPLPNGAYQIFRETGDGALAYEGSYSERYVPIGEKLEINLGSDGRVIVEEKRLTFVRENMKFSNYGDVEGFDLTEDWRLTLRNSKPREVPVEIRRHVHQADFDFTPESTKVGTWTKIDQDTFELKATLPAQSTSEFDTTIYVRTGVNARK